MDQSTPPPPGKRLKSPGWTLYRVRITAPGLPLMQRLRLRIAVYRMIWSGRHAGLGALARALESAAEGRDVTVRHWTQDGRVRRCPVDPDCAPVTGWETFLAHIYELHTDGSEPEWRRQEIVQRLLEEGPAR